METLENYQLIVKTGKTTTEKALELFDTLEPVNLAFMFGRWQGTGLHTNHPMFLLPALVRYRFYS